jgi:hypothetical protein
VFEKPSRSSFTFYIYLAAALQFVLGPRQRVPEGHPWHWSNAVHNKAIVIARAGVPGVEWIRNMMELSVRATSKIRIGPEAFTL